MGIVARVLKVECERCKTGAPSIAVRGSNLTNKINISLNAKHVTYINTTSIPPWKIACIIFYYAL